MGGANTFLSTVPLKPREKYLSSEDKLERAH